MPPPKINIAILAKAPIPGYAKTRLIPAIGAHAAAVLQARLTERTVETALASAIGSITLWCAPDASHRSFRDLQKERGLTLASQPAGDLGARMLATMQIGATLVIGTDCPAFTPAHLQAAANALQGNDMVLVPAEDGGYVLIGAREPQPGLFEAIAWSTAEVAAQTRARAAALQLTLHELPPLWDVDTEDDLARMERKFPELKL
jgi:rSAM/selenodomain-associated transferase 1